MSNGVILARLQPIHNGHLAMIEKSLQENDTTLVLIGSADKFNKRNPIPIGLRLKMAQDATNKILDKYPNKKLIIKPLDDLDDETNNTHAWGFYLFAKIVTLLKDSNFTIYYSDGYEIITTWFPTFLFRDNISLSLLARNSFVGQPISATMVRKYIMENDEEKLKELVPENVFDLREALKNFIAVSEKI